MDISQHSTHQETVQLIAHLDELERKLFAVGQSSFKSFKVRKLVTILLMLTALIIFLIQEWIRRESSKINTASLVASHRKRKFAEVSV